MKPASHNFISREPSAQVLQAPPAAKANMNGNPSAPQQARAGVQRGRQQAGSPMGRLVSSSVQGPAALPEDTPAQSEMEAVFSRYPNLAELKKPKYAERLAKMMAMWHG
jgi:hypothetical protein